MILWVRAMRTIIFFVFLVACSDDSSLGRICPSHCYWGPENTKDVGICRGGKPVCNDNMEVIACLGQVLPETEESCDGRDNFCVGLADANVGPIHPFDFWTGHYGLDNYPCLAMGECRFGNAACVNGHWDCSYPSTVELNNFGKVVEKETRCDGLDNSCDGRIDENLFTGQYCYEGPTGTEINAPCHPGSLRCVNGSIECINQHLPAPEQCDGSDNNCDGVRDNTTQTLVTDYDIVFVVDTSGSMFEEIQAVAGALNAYAEQFDNNPHYRFALVIMSTPGTINGWLSLDTDFTDFQTIRNRVSRLQSDGSGYEASLDAMFFVCDESNFFQLAWRSESVARLMFVFTDEDPQSWTTTQNPVLHQEQDVTAACIFTGTLPFIWSQNQILFEPMAVDSGGKHFELIDDWEIMFEQMNSIIVMLCEEN